MKRLILVVFLLFFSLTVFTENAEAAEKKSGKYCYEVLNKKKKTAAVTHVGKVSATVKIPKNIKGYTVVQLGRMKDISSSSSESTSKINGIFSEEDRGKVKQIKLPATLRKLGVNALKGCRNLKKIDFPKGLRYIGTRAMEKCYKIKRVVLPKELKSIGSYAFASCESIESAIFKTNKAKIGNRAFATWRVHKSSDGRLETRSSLKKIDLPLTYKGKIMDCAFGGYRGETFSWVNFTADNGAFFDGVRTLKTIKIHKKVKDVEIPRNCFDDCARQLEVVVPKNVERVYIWQQRYNIKQITIQGMDTVLEGDYAMGDGDEHNMISTETVKCDRKSLAWELVSNYICPDFTNVDWEDFTDPDTMYKESNIDTKPVKLIEI